MTVWEDAQVFLSSSQLPIGDLSIAIFRFVSKFASKQATYSRWVTGGWWKGGTLSQSWTQRETEIGCEIDGEWKEKEASRVSISLDFARIAP